MKLLDFYKSILSAGGLYADSEGLISARTSAGTTPFTVGGKRLVLPTREHMLNPNKDGIILFHPMSENIMRGESDVMHRFRTAVNLQLNYVINSLIYELIGLAISPSLHASLQPAQIETLAILKDADERTLSDMKLLQNAMPPGNIEKCFVHISMRKTAMIGGKSYRRGAIVNFPFYEELIKGGAVFGVKLRKKDQAGFTHLLEHLFPNIAAKASFNRGSFSATVPTLDALLLGIIGVASHINAIIEDYGDTLSETKNLRYNDDWVTEIDNYEQFATELKMVPPQPGNEGAVDKIAPTSAVPPLQNTAPPMQMPPPIPQQQAYGYAPPVQQQFSQPTPVLTPDGKIDFASSMRANPGVLPVMQVAGQPYLPPGPESARLNAPRWADPQPQFGAPQFANPQFNNMNQGYPNQGFGTQGMAPPQFRV